MCSRLSHSPLDQPIHGTLFQISVGVRLNFEHPRHLHDNTIQAHSGVRGQKTRPIVASLWGAWQAFSILVRTPRRMATALKIQCFFDVGSTCMAKCRL